MNNEYHFIDRWRVKGNLLEVAGILKESDFTRWWPSVYREIKEISPGDKDGLGSVGIVRAKGWLPCTINFYYRITETYYPHGYALQAWGDLSGYGRWNTEQDGEYVNVTYDWRVMADKPILRYFSFLVKPLFASNHNWTMKRGEESIKLELERCRAKTSEERSKIPPLPGPANSIPLYLLNIAGFLGLVYYFNKKWKDVPRKTT